MPPQTSPAFVVQLNKSYLLGTVHGYLRVALYYEVRYLILSPMCSSVDFVKLYSSYCCCCCRRPVHGSDTLVSVHPVIFPLLSSVDFVNLYSSHISQFPFETCSQKSLFSFCSKRYRKINIEQNYNIFG